MLQSRRDFLITVYIWGPSFGGMYPETGYFGEKRVWEMRQPWTDPGAC